MNNVAIKKEQRSYPNKIGDQQQVSSVYGNYPDPDPDQPKSILFNSQSVRHGFINKVYMIVLGQLLVTFAYVALFVFSENAKIFAIFNPWIYWVSLIGMVLSTLVIILCEEVRRKTPINFILLGLFTVTFAIVLGITFSQIAPRALLLAVGTTATICLALTLFAMQTTYDFTATGGILLACFMALMISGIVFMFMAICPTTLIGSCLCAVLFSGYLILDTQRMMDGNHMYSMSPEEYIYAALTLYLDILNIFMEFLKLLFTPK